MEQIHPQRGAIKFDRLRLDGFKSFGDRSEILIEPGLTGIVGPNGCGKSNLLEALRWALGETSARRIRGDGMDDVIFAGTERRPMRNVAEVGILLDNRRRTAPPEMNDADVLEIVRRIERGSGMSYKVNGRPCRLKDVQLLFKDNASGATSSAIVSQGRVSALINAKASERRNVLEEAAGVSGLTTRRNDFESKLRQTEQNLQRAEDSLLEVNTQAGLLRRQARALQRWREFESRIRTLQAGVLLIRTRLNAIALEKAQAGHAENEANVERTMVAAATAEKEREAAGAALVPLREARGRLDMELARAMAKLESLENENERFFREMQESQARLLEISADKSREDHAIGEAERAMAALQDEQIELAELRAEEPEAMEIQSDRLDAAREAVEAADEAASRLAADLATREASRAAAAKARAEAERKVADLEARLATAEQRLAAAVAALPDAEVAEELAMRIETGEIAVEEAAAEESENAERMVTLAGKLSELDAALAELVSEHGRLSAERAGLAGIVDGEVSAAPVLGMIRMSEGYAAAVAAAFGDALQAGLDPQEAQWWRLVEIEESATPFSGFERLSDHIGGPDPVVAAARHVWVAADEMSVRNAPTPPAGIVLVSMDGFFSRWDGLTGRVVGGGVEAGLKRAARLREIEGRLETLFPDIETRRAARDGVKADLDQARRREEEIRTQVRGVSERLRLDRTEYARMMSAGEQARRTHAIAETEVSGIRAERQNALQDLRTTGEALRAIPEDAEAETALKAARSKLQSAREAEAQARVELERLTNTQNTRRMRADALMRELGDWNKRLQQARERRADLVRRHEELEKQINEMETRKATPEAMKAEAREQVDAAKAAAEAASQALEKGERRRDEAEAESRRLEAALADMREARARILGELSQAQQTQKDLAERIVEKLGEGEHDLVTLSGLDPEGALPDPDSLEAQLHRLEHERENFGPVNFLAEQEFAEQEKRLADMEKAREEIKETIVKLRQGIKEIEEEARTKLESAFAMIDRNFARLFSELFGGGQAHLKLVGDDILTAGLEIYASPPGKRMQILSLLSGGEQTLTAMALIFAAFLCNPSPICVLDEADAALDDSNTDRLVRLVETMARDDSTRFLVITHNPLTMARMNRLIGVTMAERGISSISAISLDQAVEIVENA